MLRRACFLASMDYVSDASGEQARVIEKKLQELRPEAGILFVSVRAVPCSMGKCDTFEVRLGVTKQTGESTGRALVRWALHEEIEVKRLSILANVYPGISGAARGNTNDGQASPTPS